MNTVFEIKNAVPIQENFLGLNAVYHGYQSLYDSSGRQLTEELCELEADRAKDLNLKIARTFYKWYSYDFENNCWDFENSYDFNRFCDWMQRMKDRGIQVGINAGWINVGDVFNVGWNAPSPFNTDNIWANCVDRYADWVAESVHQLVEVRGFDNLKYLFMFTEPGIWHSRWITDPNAKINGIEAWCQCVRAVDKKLKERNLRKYVKLVGANEGNGLDPLILKWFAENEPNIVDIYSSHYYLTHLYPYENEELPGNCKHIFGGDFPGARIQQRVKLKPSSEYEFSFFAKLKAQNPKKLSGYAIYGAFKIGEKDKGLIQSGDQPTNRLGRYTTAMREASRFADKWEKITLNFKTEDDTQNAAVGIFFDAKEENFYSILTTGFSLKEKGSEVELIKDGELLGFDDYEVYPEIYKEVKCDPYDVLTDYINTCLSYVPKGKEFWWDEFNIINEACWTKPVPSPVLPDKESTEFGTLLGVTSIAFLNSGIQSPWAWTLFDQQWPCNHSDGKDRFEDGIHKHGVMPYLRLSKVPYPSYFARRVMCLVGGGEGTKVYKGECDRFIKTTMTESADGDITLLIANQGESEKTFTLNFERDIDRTLYRYSFDPATVVCEEDIPPLKNDGSVEVKNSFTVKLQPGEVVAYHTKQL